MSDNNDALIAIVAANASQERRNQQNNLHCVQQALQAQYRTDFYRTVLQSGFLHDGTSVWKDEK